MQSFTTTVLKNKGRLYNDAHYWHELKAPVRSVF